MKSKLLAASLIAAPVLVGLKPIADDVAFHPADGSSASKEYKISASFSLGDLSATVDGQDMSESLPGEAEVTAELLMNVTDQYVSTVDGRPHELIRSYDGLSLEWETPDESGESDELADMEGKRVLFKWDPDSEIYDKSYYECDGDEEALDSVSPEMDLQALLPDGEVSEGDSWTVPASKLGPVLVFGAESSELNLDDDEFGAMMAAEIVPQVEQLMEQLEAHCEYRGRQDADGRSLGLIAVTLSGDGDIDLGGLITSIAETQIPPEVGVELAIDEATLSISVDAEGELLWDLETGLFRSYEMTAEIEVLGDFAIAADAQGESHDLEASAEVLGEITWSATQGE